MKVKMDKEKENNDEKSEDTINENCIDCHFLSKFFFIDTKQEGLENIEYIIPLTQYDRDQAKLKNFDWQLNNLEDKKYKLRCYFRVWDEEVDLLDFDKKVENISGIERKDNCSFWKYDKKSGFSNIEKIENETGKKYQEVWYNFLLNFVMIAAIIFLIIDIIYMSR